MSDLTPNAREELSRLEERTQKLAVDKSYLELVIRLMTKVSDASGLEDTIHRTLHNITDVVGGTNIALYYRSNDEILYEDVLGQKRRLDRIEDELVQRVFTSREAVEFEHDFSATQMGTPEFSKAYTWVYPLLVGPEIIGVIKLESLHLRMREMYQHLPAFFSFVALALKNEITGLSRLQQAYTALEQEVAVRQRAEEELRLANATLETRVAERTRELERSNEQARRFNRELQALSDCNQVLMRAADEQTLLDDICRIVCDQAGYRMAWVGYVEHDEAKIIRPAAWAGHESGYIAGVRLSWSESDPRGRGPAGIAVREGRTLYIQDMTADERFALWRQEALARGYRSGIALPLKGENGAVFGVLLIYSGELNAITPEEVRLLEELAGDLAFGITVLRDRTERRRADEALRTNEQRYRMAESIGRVGNWEYNLQSGEFWGSDEAKRIYGFDPSQINFTTDEVENCIPERERVHQALVDLIEAGKPYDLEFEIRPKNSSELRIISSVAKLQRNEQGAPVLIAGVVQDITERKSAAAALRESEERYRLVFENSPISIWEEDFSGVKTFLDDLKQTGVTDLAAHFARHPEAVRQCAALAKVVNVNQAALTLHAAASKADLLAGLVNTFTPESFEAFQQELLCLWHGGMAMACDSVVKTLAGEPRHVTVYFSVCPGYEETLTKVLVSLTDITERKQAEKASRLSSERLQLATRAARIGIWDWDVVKNELVWDDSMYQLYGIKKGDFGGAYDAWIRTVHPEDKAYTDGEIQAALRGEREYAPEFRIVRPDGSIGYIKADSRTIKDQDGKPLRMIGTNIDITERKRVEDALMFVAQRGWQTGTENFLNTLARFLCEKLDMEYAFVDKVDENRDVAETVALCAKGVIAPNLRYALKGTPCENVMGRKLCVYCDGIQQTFPEDALLAQMGAESYIGIPLWDSSGQPIGLIAVMGTKPLPDVAPATQLLQLVATRAAAELERNRAAEALAKLNAELEQRVRERTAELRLEMDSRSRQQQFLEAVLENIDAGIVACDADGILTLFNRRTRELHGLPAQPIPAEQWAENYDLFLPDGKTPMRKEDVPLFRALQGGRVVNNEMMIIPHGGEPKTLLASGQFILDEEGRKIGAVIAMHDITERKRMEETLRASEEKYRSVVENIGLGVTMIGPGMEILALNACMQKWFPHIDARCHPTCYESFINPPRSGLCVNCPTCQTLQDGQVHEGIIETPAGDKTLYFRVLSSPIKDKDGKVVAATEIVEDVTERRRAEENIQQLNRELRQRASELQTANQELQRMNKLFVGRELRMVELKKRIQELEPRSAPSQPESKT